MGVLMKTSRFGIITTLFFLMITLKSYSQPPVPTWQIEYHTDRQTYFHGVDQIPDLGYIIKGHTYTNGDPRYNQLLVMIDSVGDTLWTHEQFWPGHDVIHECIETTDGNLIFVGYRRPYLSDNTSIYVEKMDFEGNSLWVEEYGLWGYSSGSSIVELDDGGFLIGAQEQDHHYDDYYLVLMQIDSIGTELWRQTYQLTDYDQFIDLILTSDNGFLIAANSAYQAPLLTTDIWLIKIDSNGEEQWNTIIGGANDDYCTEVLEDDDGGFVVVGGSTSFAPGESRMYTAKVDSDGNHLWQYTFGGEFGSSLRSVIKSSDGNFIAAGSATLEEQHVYYSYMIKFNDEGDIIWSGSIDDISGGSLGAVEHTDDGGFIVAGWNRNGGISPPPYGTIYKFDQENFVNEIQNDLPLDFTINSIYPNPFNPSSTIDLTIPYTSNLKIVLFNSLGQQVETIANGVYSEGRYSFQIDGSNLSSGNYFLQPIINDLQMQSRSLVLIK